ncbi:MAG TPA: endopeptidase La [Chloroflexota bacterium]|nr:endopeptidase La [Chloroflexota bacterium]
MHDENRSNTEQNEHKWEIPEVLPILPLKDTVIYPYTAAPLAVGQERSLRLIEHVVAGNRLVGLVAVKDPNAERGEPENSYTIGSLARIDQVLRIPDGTVRLLVRGLKRIRITEYVEREPFLVAHVEEMPETVEEGVEVEALVRNAQSLFQKLVGLSPTLPDELATAVINLEDTLQVIYFIANNLRLELIERQELLSIDSAKSKLEWLNGVLTREIEVLELGKRIQSEAQERMTKAQREYYLREQLKAIRKELGEVEDEQSEYDSLRAKIEAANLPEEARKEAERELARMEKLSPASPEHSVIRTYLDWITALPWNVSVGEPIDIARARQILDEDHYDLARVKDRILEYLAVLKLREERTESGEVDGEHREPILCFVGPPGVGKTSLGHSIARAMGRKFVRMSLGGVHDEAEIRGHRRTYIGAMPGRFIQAIRRAESNNPVFMLDEVDKVGSDWRGDPSSALLEALDPEQNKDFRDHYLDVPFDLSHVMFITTANTLDTIPAPLRDRMEIIQLPGYTEEEKVQIADKYLVPKQRRAHGLKPEEVSFTDDGLRTIIRDYTREAGVRNVEREIAAAIRKVATRIAEGKAQSVTVDSAMVRELLGRPKYFGEVAERIDRPGVATGMVWTPVGGEIMFVEATLMPGKKSLKLTGQMGDVMKESAETALSYVRSQAKDLGIDPLFFENHDIHIHVPAGAVPKEGPSAGVTLVTALVSLLTGRLVRSDVAMTGEITLRGKVLPVGGIKEKVLGARRVGITTVILPRRNEHDLEELPSELRSSMNFVLVDNADEVLAAALVPETTVMPAVVHEGSPDTEEALVA